MSRLNKSLSSVPGSSKINKKIAHPTADLSCKYKPRKCYQPVLDNYDYCLKHILEDKNAPFKPCNYLYPTNNKRCFMPARNEKNDSGYCALHYWKCHVKSQRKSTKHAPPTTPEYLLSGLAHYVRSARGSKEDDQKNSKKALNPFEAFLNKSTQNKSHFVEYASDSDSDIEPVTLDSLWQGGNEESSEAESIDSQYDEPLSKLDESSSLPILNFHENANFDLRRAGYFTSEEVVCMAKNRLMRLQVLYQKQFDRLQYVYCERRRHYLHALRKEKETLCSIYNQAKTSSKEQKLYERLKALTRYQKKSNAESLAFLQGLSKRAKDKTQCLFKPCDCVKADSNCQVPVAGVGSDETCLLHVRLPVLPHSNYPDNEIKLDCDGDKKSTDDSEVDASATESAFSTDQRDSPENSIINNEDLARKEDDPELFCGKTEFSDTCDATLQESLMDVTEASNVVKEEEITTENNESLKDEPL